MDNSFATQTKFTYLNDQVRLFPDP